MSERIHALAYQLFGKISIEEIELSQIQQLANDQPYFAPAQFLLLQKLKSTDSDAFQAQLQKAVLYYPNALEFERFINSDKFYTELNFRNKIEENIETEILRPAETTEEEIPIEEAVSTNPSPESETIEEEIVDDELKELHQSIKEKQSEEENRVVINSLNVDDSIQKENIDIPTPPPPQTLNPKPESDLTFEPYHTVDYFASQGIRLSQEEISQDKFGKQLKSFTEWLKSMKRLPAPEGQKPETNSEKKVQHLAEDSVHQADVVTEAMAEVWLKQGNKEKAIETYNKLSLINPSKKAYFAGLIQILKNS